MKKTAVPDYPRGVTFEQVWAALQDLAEQQKRFQKEAEKRQKEADKERKERQREAAERQREAEEERKVRQQEAEKRQQEAEARRKENEELEKKSREEREESDRKWNKRMARLNKSMGDLSNRFGELAEHLVAPGINKRFNELGYHFNELATKGCVIWGEDGKIKAEIDLLLQNGETVMAVEVKATPKVKHIEEHVKQLEILRDHRRKLNDNRHVEGAIAGAVFGNDEKKATIEAGLYVIEQTGDTMKINVPDGFVPRRWE